MATDSVFGLGVFGEMVVSGPFQNVPGWIEIVDGCSEVADGGNNVLVKNQTLTVGQSVFGGNVVAQVNEQEIVQSSLWTDIKPDCY